MLLNTRSFTSPVGLSCTKVAGHIPARISEVPSWDAKIVFIFFNKF